MSAESFKTPSGWTIERWGDDTCWLVTPDEGRFPIESFVPARCVCGEVLRRRSKVPPYEWEHLLSGVITCADGSSRPAQLAAREGVQ